MTTVTDEVMRQWGWSEEAIAWYKEDRDRLNDMHDRERGFYEGFLHACFYENAMHKEGLSHHRFPQDEIIWGAEGDPLMPDFRDLLAVMADIDDEGQIFLPGYAQLTAPWGGDDFLFLQCSEALDPKDGEEVYPTVQWGYREAYAAYKEVHA